MHETDALDHSSPLPPYCLFIQQFIGIATYLMALHRSISQWAYGLDCYALAMD